VHAMALVGSASSSRVSASRANVLFVGGTVHAMASASVGSSSSSRVSASRANLLFVGRSAVRWHGG
jgi:DeoR/GlpR family transcriptional regulator of sugar metabolism